MTSPGCVDNNNLVLYTAKTIPECKSLCDARADCLGFEYGVDHGSSNTQYAPGDCQLTGPDTDTTGCDGQDFNLDFYLKGGHCGQCFANYNRVARRKDHYAGIGAYVAPMA